MSNHMTQIKTIWNTPFPQPQMAGHSRSDSRAVRQNSKRETHCLLLTFNLTGCESRCLQPSAASLEMKLVVEAQRTAEKEAEAGPAWPRASSAFSYQWQPGRAHQFCLGTGARESHLEQERVLADPLDRGQQVALQRDVSGLPAPQKHAALQRT